MYRNLMFEFEKNNIKTSDAAIFLGVKSEILEKKLIGQKEFNITECLKLQDLIGKEDLCLDYLFKK